MHITGRLFDVYTDYVREPEGETARRDVIRHSGSVVILAVDDTRNPADPLIVIERQYRHAAGQYMWEIPAGRKEPEEATLPGAKRELLEETGYIAKRWTKIARFYVSPGFLGEWMQVYLAEGLSCGQCAPDEDEYIRAPTDSAITSAAVGGKRKNYRRQIDHRDSAVCAAVAPAGML